MSNTGSIHWASSLIFPTAVFIAYSYWYTGHYMFSSFQWISSLINILITCFNFFRIVHRTKRGNVIFYYYFKKMLIEKCDTIFMKIKALKILSTMVFRKLCPKKFSVLLQRWTFSSHQQISSSNKIFWNNMCQTWS